MNNMIKVATAECFTHGYIAREIHAFARGYPLTYTWHLDNAQYHISLVSGLFIPTLSGVRQILHIEPIIPICSPDDIKIYDQKQDGTMALQMASAVRRITSSHIGIGTSAGIGTGGIALVTADTILTGTTDVYADLRFSDADTIMQRQSLGISNALHLFENLVENGIDTSVP